MLGFAQKWEDGDKVNCAARFASEQKIKRREHNIVLLGPVCSAPAEPASYLLDQSRQLSRIMNNIIWLVGAVVIVLFVLGYFGLR
jgi:predicted nucleic acid-binding Zn ribbon protein